MVLLYKLFSYYLLYLPYLNHLVSLAFILSYIPIIIYPLSCLNYLGSMFYYYTTAVVLMFTLGFEPPHQEMHRFPFAAYSFFSIFFHLFLSFSVFIALKSLASLCKPNKTNLSKVTY